ncbi:hypothetical protein LINPERPRIM_LOCUS24809 [Linum perenne]
MVITLACLLFTSSSFGTVTVSTPSSREGFTLSKSAFKGSLNCLQNFPEALSALCHFSPSTSPCSDLLSPLIRRTLFSSTSILTSSFFKPGMSRVIKWEFWVSFQSALASARVSIPIPLAGNGILVSGLCSRIRNGSSGGTIMSHSDLEYGIRDSEGVAIKLRIITSTVTEATGDMAIINSSG